MELARSAFVSPHQRVVHSRHSLAAVNPTGKALSQLHFETLYDDDDDLGFRAPQQGSYMAPIETLETIRGDTVATERH